MQALEVSQTVFQQGFVAPLGAPHLMAGSSGSDSSVFLGC